MSEERTPVPARRAMRRSAVALGLLLWAGASRAGSPPADLVLLNGDVYTVDAARSWASAVVIAGDRIAFVGSDQEARRRAGDRARLIDLHGRMVLPGFVDSHVHPGPAGVFLDRAQLDGLQTREAVLAAVAAYAAAHPDATWIEGAGWNESAFLPSGLPTRQMLDAVVPDRPAFLENNSGHAGWANSKALALAGVTAATPDPPNGRIERETDGTPSGVLQEYAMELVMSHRPPRSAEATRAALQAGLRRLETLGVTAIVDAYVTPDFLAAYQALDAAGGLRLRTLGCLAFEPAEDDARQLGQFRAARARPGRRFAATCVKFMLDGVPEHHTAALLEPYSDDAKFGRGPTFIEPARLDALVQRLEADHFQVHMHAIGDRAVREGLDAIEAARKRNGPSDTRPTLAHLGLIDPQDLTRFRTLGVVANMTPLWSRGDDWETVIEPRVLGAERSRRMLQSETLLRAGVVLAWGTDWPVTSAAPLDGIETAITRRYLGGIDPQGHADSSWFPEERTTLEQAIVAYTMAGAYLAHAEHERGSIETGKLADLVVLGQNLFDVAPLRIHEVTTDLTLIGGEIVYERRPLEQPIAHSRAPYSE